MPGPFQIIQSPHTIVMSYEYVRSLRTIYMNPWTMPRTPDGKPDLNGSWTSISFSLTFRKNRFNL
jgi:hypothetical protein